MADEPTTFSGDAVSENKQEEEQKPSTINSRLIVNGQGKPAVKVFLVKTKS